MKTKTKFFIALVLLYTAGLMAFFSFACANDVPAHKREQPYTQTPDTHLVSTEAPTPKTIPEVSVGASPSTHPTPPTIHTAPARRTTGPVLVSVLVDFSASISFYGVEIPTVQSLLPLIQLIDERGGELGVGAIQENPSTPLLRLRIPPPEKGLEPPDESVNVFTRKRRLRAYRKALPEHQERERQRRAENKTLIDAYLPQLKAFLSKPASAQITELWGNVDRSSLFLMEPSLYWTRSMQTAPLRFLILVTDGRHNATSEFKRPDKSIVVCAVSGSKGLGDINRIRGVSWFESTASAVYFVVAKAGGK